jgi:Domain of unknown function (DUF4389)
MSAYFYGSGGRAQAPAIDQSTPAPVLAWFAGPAPQSRLTVLFRIFMVIPHAILLWLMAIAAGVITFIGWFGALFTGRLPVFAADFLTGYIRWVTRVQAYTWLLTGEYPPFTLADPAYPVRLAVAPGRPLNRAAVFFRFFLLIPCWIVQTIVSYGAFTVFQLANWLIVLINGQMPDTIYQALSAVLRYNARVLGFALMLTSAYPSELFGDADVTGLYGQPYPGYGAGTAGGWQWPLVLSAAARKLVIFFIVFGAVVSAGAGAYNTTMLSSSVSTLAAAAQVSADVAPVRTALDSYPSGVQACRGELDCVTGLDRKLAATLDTFAVQLQIISMPSQAATANASLITAVSSTAASFARLGSATSAGQYTSIARSSGVQQAGDRVEAAYDNLVSALTS